MRRLSGRDGLEPVRFGAGGYLTMVFSALVLTASMGASLVTVLAWIAAKGWRAPHGGLPGGRVLVLGMQLDRSGHPVPTYQRRLNRSHALWRADPEREIILLGGRTRPLALSEGAAGRLYLQTLGLPAERITLEDRSRHTLENLRIYRAQFEPGSRPPILVTSRFHLARASLLANGLGIRHVACAAERHPAALLRHPIRLLIEGIFVHWYLTSRFFFRLTGNRDLAAEIS